MKMVVHFFQTSGYLFGTFSLYNEFSDSHFILHSNKNKQSSHIVEVPKILKEIRIYLVDVESQGIRFAI